MTYNAAAGSFTAIVDASTIPPNTYLLKITTPHYLVAQYPGIITISAGNSVTLPSIRLIAGDSNSDNKLDILDYNLILDCYASLGAPRNCADQAKKDATDLTDDGLVDQIDYNLFLRELSVQIGN